MSKAARRGSRSRRTPQRAKGSAGFQVPWVPVIFAVGGIAVVALIVYLVLQSGGSSANFTAEDIAAESDSDPNIPGQFVDLAAVYGGAYPATAGHVSNQVDYSDQGVAPPVGGPHWSGACGEDPTAAPAFCGPAPWGIYRDPWPAATVVHNMEHGGIVVWYNTTDQATIDDLESLITSELNDQKLIVMTPYLDMEDGMIAISSWSRIDKFPVSEYTQDRIKTFIDVNERRFNPEHF